MGCFSVEAGLEEDVIVDVDGILVVGVVGVAAVAVDCVGVQVGSCDGVGEVAAFAEDGSEEMAPLFGGD